MEAALRVLRTLGLLLVMWAALFGVAVGLDVIPAHTMASLHALVGDAQPTRDGGDGTEGDGALESPNVTRTSAGPADGPNRGGELPDAPEATANSGAPSDTSRTDATGGHASPAGAEEPSTPRPSIASGAPPPEPHTGETEGTSPGNEPASRDSIEHAGSAEPHRATTPIHAASAVASAPVLQRYEVCARGESTGVLEVDDIIGDPREDVLVGCGPNLLVLTPERFGATSTLVRAISIATASADLLFTAARGMDVDGDGMVDLLVGLGPEGATDGGGLYSLRRLPTGAFDTPKSLGALGVASIVPGRAAGGADPWFAVLGLGRPYAARPGEVWTYHGGASPSRTGTQRVGLRSSDMVSLDLDRDGEPDLVTLSLEGGRVDLLRGLGRGRFGDGKRAAFESARALVVGGFGQGGVAEAVILGNGAAALRLDVGTGELGLERLTVEKPAFDAEAVDLDGDRRTDLLVALRDRVVWLRASGDGEFEEREVITLAGGAGVARIATGDADADGRPEIMVVATHDDGRVELAVIYGGQRGARRLEADGALTPMRGTPIELVYSVR